MSNKVPCRACEHITGRVPYAQMIIELDKLILGVKSTHTDAQVLERADTIEAYIKACGWDWESIVNYMAENE